MLSKNKIENKIVNNIINIINKNKNKFFDTSHETATKNGFQTPNIVNLFDDSLKKQILNGHDFYKDIFHIHYIEYYQNGAQEEHDHFKTEEYSFILYLNDAIGNTFFENDVISPEKGLLVIFDSRLKHKSLNCYNKKILVGAIKEKYRV
jgi:hypothetical protein|tara:strand:- start:85 stop:531 length:447 start_codon:yes stop_codon:yes gene_type:complete